MVRFSLFDAFRVQKENPEFVTGSPLRHNTCFVHNIKPPAEYWLHFSETSKLHLGQEALYTNSPVGHHLWFWWSVKVKMQRNQGQKHPVTRRIYSCFLAKTKGVKGRSHGWWSHQIFGDSCLIISLGMQEMPWEGKTGSNRHSEDITQMQFWGLCSRREWLDGAGAGRGTGKGKD